MSSSSSTTSTPRPFYSPITPNRLVTTKDNKFPFPSISREDLPTTRLLNTEIEEEEEEEERIGFDDNNNNDLENESDNSVTYGNNSGTSSPNSDNGHMTPLDLSLEKIGMRKYQWTLLILCGLGWMADNMWLQCVAVILPRVQEHYSVSDKWIGLLSTSIFTGMMFGAWGWGSYSDSKGRTPAFNLTLLLTSVFGIASAFAPSFAWLCFALFGLGTGVGGSMPTDGTLFLENIPKTHHYLLTALSTFFSFGAVLTSLLGLYFIPRFSCPEHLKEGQICNVEVENKGWRFMLLSLGIISIVMFIARIALFRLKESAKFLMTSNRTSEAIIALTRISKINGNPQVWSKADVIDILSVPIPTNNNNNNNNLGGINYDANGYSPEGSIRREIFVDTSLRGNTNLSPEVVGSTSTSPTTSIPISPTRRSSLHQPKRPRPRPITRSSSNSIISTNETTQKLISKLPKSIQMNLEEYFNRINGLFLKEWKLTTILVWFIWFLASFSYTIFNVFLPKYLEQKMGGQKLLSSGRGGGRESSLKEYVMYTMSGMPGSILGAYLIETSWGRRGTMTISTLITSIGVFIFVLVDSQFDVVLSSMLVSLSATLMYAVIYGYTPEVFPSNYRGTACGIASAFSRLAGLIAPILTGIFLEWNLNLPLFITGFGFAFTAICMWNLPIETRKIGGGGIGRGRVVGMGSH